MKLRCQAAFCLVVLFGAAPHGVQAGHLNFFNVSRTSSLRGQALQVAPLMDQDFSTLQLGGAQMPPPPPALGPNPMLTWIENTPMPGPPTLPPLPEQCFACRCMMVFPGAFLNGGTIGNDYSCHGGAATKKVPEITWASELADSFRFQDRSSGDCPDCMSFAVTMEDLDYPYGVGESGNTIHNMFWAVNIPGDWRSLTSENVVMEDAGEPVVVVGRNSKGKMEMEMPCPHKGTHRYRITLWALGSMLGTKMDPVNPGTSYAELVPQLENLEMARASIMGSLKSPGAEPGKPFPPSFLQQLREGLR